MTAAVGMRDALRGALIGTAVGDALGLPWEGMRGEWVRGRVPTGRFAILGRRGLLSDDTEQSWLVACALAEAGLDPEAAARAFAWRLRRWFLALPPGIGLGTARAVGKLLLGFGPARSGVRTAGNGAAMRAAVVGVAADRDRLGPLVDAISRVTHTDPRAVEGARVIALAAHLGRKHGTAGRRVGAGELLAEAADPELRANLARAIALADDRRNAGALVASLGAGDQVTGFVNHTVPAAVFLWLAHDDLEQAVTAAVELGGDTDTVAAIAGALVGATVGFDAIPRPLVAGLGDWPLRADSLLQAADRLAEAVERQEVVTAPTLPWAGFLVRNLAVLPLFVVHVIWRRVGLR